MSPPNSGPGPQSRPVIPPGPLRRSLAGLTVGAMIAAALVYALSMMGLALGPEDIGRLETPFALSVAKQLEQGPGVLYGPYDSGNPLVLIHAPLYYRLAALGAAILHRFGMEPVTASLVAGRLLSIAAMVLILAAAALLACRDGGSARAAVFAVLLIAAAPIPGILSVMVRPDAMAVALQTWGVVWVLSALIRDPQASPARDLVRAYAAFALAFCTKQHSLLAPAISSTWLAIAVIRGRMRLGPVALAHLAGLVIVLVDLIAEQVVTGGRMIQSAFVLPGGSFRAILLGSWPHVAATCTIAAKKLIGYIVLGGCCAWIAVRSRSTINRLDRLLLVYTAAEVASQLPLYYYNSGAADNYLFQAVIFVCVLLGRCLARLLEVPDAQTWTLALAALGSSLIAARDLQFAEILWRTRTEDRAAVRSMLGRPPVAHLGNEAIYFVDRPDLNRLHGNVRLAHDEFAYGAFETVGAADRRSSWLRYAIETGAVHIVVIPDDRTTISGVRESLAELGYHRAGRFGDHRVWERQP